MTAPDPTSTEMLMDTVLKGVIGGAIIVLLGFFISQIVKGVWVTRWQYDAMLRMKDELLADQKAEIARLESKLERVDITLAESAHTMHQVIGAAVRQGPPNG